MALPAGFVIDKPEKVKLPSGFVLDSDKAGLPSIVKSEPREAPTYDPLGQVIGDVPAPLDYQVEGQGRMNESGALTTLSDLVKQFIAPGVKAPFAIPQATETAFKGAARQAMEGTPEAIMPSSVFQPGLDTEETLFGPETDVQKARRKLQAQRAVAAMPSIPGAAALNKIGENVQKDILGSLSPEAKKALKESQITGNIFKGEVDFGTNPNAYGYALQAANVFGSMAPVIATAMVTKSPGAGGFVGGTMAADEAATSAAEFINKIPDAELRQKSPFYAELIAGGASPKEARALTIKKAAESGAALQGLVATFGDVLTGKLVTGAFDKTIAKLGTNRLARAGGVGAASSLEEALQETGEGLSSDVALKNIIPSKELGEDSAANFILGALGGAGPGVLKGALSEAEAKAPEREKYVQPEGGLAELMARQKGFLTPEGRSPAPPAAPAAQSPVPPAPPAGPAEVIQAPGSEAMDTQAMLEELINSVNYPQGKAPEVKAEKQLTQEEIDKQEQQDRFLAEMQDLLDDVSDRDDKYIETPPAQPEAPTKLYTFAGEGVKTNTDPPTRVPKTALVFEGVNEIKDFAAQNNVGGYLMTGIGGGKMVLGRLGGKDFITESNIDSFKKKPAPVEAPTTTPETREEYPALSKTEVEELGLAPKPKVEKPAEPKIDYLNHPDNVGSDASSKREFDNKGKLQVAPQNIADGGTPFKSKAAADTARKNYPDMRVLRTADKKGFILAPKTPKQIAADEAKAKRLGLPRTTTKGTPMAAHQFITSEGGITKDAMKDLGMDENVRSGNRSLFSDSGMSMEQAYMKLQEAGYLEEGATQNDARNLITESVKKPKYRQQDIEEMAKRAEQADYEDYLKAEEEAALYSPVDEEMGYEMGDFEGTGYEGASPEVQAEVRALLAQADALGINTESIREEIFYETENQSIQAYYKAFKSALEDAITASRQDRIEDTGQPGGAGTEFELTSPTKEGLIEAEDEFERRRLEQFYESEAVMKKIRADKEAEEFALVGSDREADVAAARGQRDIFADTPAETTVAESPKPQTQQERTVTLTKKEFREDNETRGKSDHPALKMVFKGETPKSLIAKYGEKDVRFLGRLFDIDVKDKLNVAKKLIAIDSGLSLVRGKDKAYFDKMNKAQLGEFLEAVGQSAYGQKYQLVERLLKHEGNVMGKFNDNLQDLKHKAAVLNEARAGKPISEEVLKDYPDVAAYSLPRDSEGYKNAIRSLAIKALPSLGMDTPQQIERFRYDAQYSKDPAEKYVAADIADYMESYYKSQQEKSNQTMAKLGAGTGPTMSEMIAENKRVKAELAALEKAEKGPLTEAEKEAAEEAAEEEIRNKAEAEIDEGPIGQAIAKIENGDIETKAQIRSLINKLERDGTLDDVEDVREGLSDREQDASEVLDTLSGLLDDARDSAIDERFDELLEESAQEETAEEVVEEPAEEPSFEVQTPEGNTLTYPAAYGLVNTGYTVLSLNDPRTYTDKGGTQHRTFEKDGARIAVSPNQVLFEWKGRVQYGMGNPNELTLEMLAVDPKDRGKGKGTQVLKDLTKVADQYGITLYGEPVPIVNLKQNDVGLDFDQLVNLYKKFDFKFQETDSGVSERVIVRQPEAEVLAAEEPQIAGQVGFEPYTMEGDFTEVAEEQQRLMLEDQTENLSDAQVSTLEKHYGAKIDSDEFFTKLREDVSNFIVKGATAVNGKIRAIIRQLANGVLAVGIAFNPQYMSQPINVFMPVDNVRTEEVLATVPDAATDKMSEPAKRAFAVIYPALQEQMVAKDKLFIMADKPSGRMFVFNPDGSLLLEKKSLFGLAKGDLYVGDNDKPQNRITPAGLFDLKFVDAAKGAAEKRTAGDYDTGTVLAINDPDGTITIMHSVWLKEKDAAQRAAALRNESPADSRYSFGCINVDAPTYKYMVDNHAKQMDGAALFIVPEAGVDVMSFITGKGAMSEDLARIKIKPVTKEVRTPQRQATQAEAKTKTPGREQQFFSLEKPKKTPKIESPEFKKWFGNSVIVNKSGKPLVVYHGSDTKRITEFKGDLRGGIIYATEDRSYAEAYSENNTVYPLYMRMEKPAEITDPVVLKVLGDVFEKYGETAADIQEAYDDGADMYEYFENDEVIAKLKELGYDGVMFDEEGQLSLGVFSPNQIKSATKNVGTFDESGNITMSVEGKKLPPGRSPELAAAARLVKEGKMTAAEFDKMVNQYKPIRPYEAPLKPATRAEMVDALSSEKKDKVSPDIPEGTRVGLRLDIPAFNRKGVYVVTIHEKGNASGPGKAIGYDSVAVINNVNFGTGSQKKALNIATGEAKDALQTMEGEFVKSDPAAVYAAALKAMDDPSWTQIGVDPTRHAYFFDRNTTQPVVAAEQVIQIGNTVLAKNVTYGRKEDFLYNLEDDLVKLVNDTADSIDETEKKRSPSFKRKAKVLTNQRNEGKLTDEEYLDRMNAAIAEDEENRLGVDRKDRVRGADFIREKLLNAKRNGFLSDEAVDLAEWFIGQNPALVDDLGISIKGKGPEGAGGFYNPLARVFTLIKEGGSDLTTTHEILHHLERMMPAKIQDAIRKAWLTQLMKANKAAKDPAQKLYFAALLDAHIGNNNHTRLEVPKGAEKLYESIVQQMKFANELSGGRGADPKSTALAKELLLYAPTVPSGFYEYFDPSEFWAVNGSDIVRARYDAVKGGVLARLKNWLRELGQKIKSMFGLKSDASIIRALDSLAKSDGVFVTSEMLGAGDYASIERRNYEGGEAPEPDMEIPEMSFMDDVIYKYGDKLIDTKRLIQSIQSTGRKINEKFDAYMKEENYHGRLAKRTKNFLNDEMRPVLEDMQERGVTLDELETFLLNRHAKEANAYIARINPTGFPEAGSSVSDAAADKYMAELTPEKRKDLMALAAKVDAIVKETQRVLVANGLETQDTIDEWNATYKHYVPLQRDNLDFVHTGRGVMGGFATRGSASKRRVGSDKPVIDIFANIAMQRERALRRSEQARVGRALYGMAIKHPNPGFWLAINPDAIKDKDKLEAELISLGLTPEDARSIIQEPRQPMFDKKTGTVKYQVNPLLRNSPNVFPIRINGEDRFIFFNPNDPRALRMVQSIRNLDTERLGDAIGMASMVTRWFASVNTQYNIVFGGVNFLRDLSAASLNLSTTEIAGKEKQVRANVLPALRAIYRELRGKGATTEAMAEMQDWFERFQLAGGQTGYQNQFAETKRKGNVVEQELKRLNRGNVKKSVDAIFDWLSDYNDAIENAVRLSAFKVAVESGLSEDKAASIAKNLTVNFNRKGARTGLISSLYAFFNAAVQGSARMVETLRGPMGKKIIFGGMFLGSMQAIALAMAGFDDDEPPEFVKDKNLIIPIPYTDKKYLSIPMPLGFNMFPGFGRLAMETLLIETGMIRSRKGPGDKVMSAVSLVFDAFNPLGGSGNPLLMAVPTIGDPFAAIYSNKDSFGRPIYKEDRGTAPTPGYERSRENASILSKKLAEAINWATSPAGTQHTKGWASPTADQIDYFIGQITGGVGREIMKVGEFAKSKAVTQEEVPAYKLPIVGRFYGEAESPAATRSRFYENVKEMAKHEYEIKGLRKDRISPAEYVKANPEARLWQRANNVENQIVKLNKEKRALIEKDAPREAVKRKEDEILKKMTEFNNQVRRGQ